MHVDVVVIALSILVSLLMHCRCCQIVK